MYRQIGKPLLDRIFALILLMLLSPVILVLVFMIWLFMGEPVFFRQPRPGQGGKIFTIYKFRTMSNERNSQGNLLPDENRLNRSGTLIRQMSLDELPQLYNVLKGEMSFVGPRPLLVEYLELYNKDQQRRHEVKPGITGWAQVNGRNAISWEEKFKYDVWYVEHQSFLLDMKILWLTILKVLKKDDISAEEHVTMEAFKGNSK